MKIVDGLCAGTLWLIAGLLAGCTTLPVAEPPVTVVSTPAVEATVPEQDEEGLNAAWEEISIDGRTATLPAQIEAAKRELSVEGDPVAHQYVEVTGADGTVWQGEQLANEEQSVLFLQARGGDGRRALRISGEPALAIGTLIDQLPAGPAQGGQAPDVQVEAVNPRRVDENDTGGRWRFDVTIRHPDTGWDDYVDAWLVIGPDNTVYGTRILLHPHETEQPFTRSLNDVEIPADVTEITIRPHDLVSGYDDGLTLPLMAGPQPTPTP